MKTMSAIPPLSGNKCKGKNEDGTSNVQFYCLKGNDNGGDPIFTCTKWRKFKADCPRGNYQCNAISEAWVAAVTICTQKIF